MMYMHMAFTLTNQELGQRTDSHKMLTPTWRRVRSGPLPRTLLPWTARWVRRWTPRSPPTPQALQIYASQIQAEAGGHVDLPIYLSIQVFIHLSLSLSPSPGLAGKSWLRRRGRRRRRRRETGASFQAKRAKIAMSDPEY